MMLSVWLGAWSKRGRLGPAGKVLFYDAVAPHDPFFGLI